MNESRNTIMVKDKFQNQMMMQTVLTTFITLNVIVMLSFLLEDQLNNLDYSFNVFSLFVAALELVGIVAVYLFSQRISFRIAGPVYAIERSLRAVHEGDLTVQLKLRDGDYFFEASDTLNQTIHTLRTRVDIMQQISSQLENTDDPEARDSLQKSLSDQLAFFQTVEEEK